MPVVDMEAKYILSDAEIAQMATEDGATKWLRTKGITSLVVSGSGRKPTKHDVPQLAKRLPLWVKKYRVSIYAAGGKILLGEPDFRFNRGQEKKKLVEETASLTATQRLAESYQQKATEIQRRIDDLKAKASEKNQGKLIEELRREILEWPTVIDITFGPGPDPITGVMLAVNEFVITFLPVAFEGNDLEADAFPSKTRPEPGAWCVTNPVRFRVNEAGRINGLGNGFTATYHPHMHLDTYCAGNIGHTFNVAVRENNIPTALAVLEEWRIGHGRNHYQDRNWHRGAVAWWQDTFLKKKAERKPEAWLFNGQWNGDLIQLARPGGQPTLTSMREFFGGELEDIMHVAEWKSFVTPDEVAAYVKSKDNRSGDCFKCGRAVVNCACHAGGACECGASVNKCACTPVKGWFPPVAKWHYLEEEWRVIDRGTNAFCEQRVGRWRDYCYQPATVTITRTKTAGLPRHLCDNHTPKAALTARVKATKLARAEADGTLVPNVPDGRRGNVLRHRHKHTHNTDGLKRDGHAHFHEHYTAEAVTEQINEHADNHTAYTYEKGDTVRRQNHKEIR